MEFGGDSLEEREALRQRENVWEKEIIGNRMRDLTATRSSEPRKGIKRRWPNLLHSVTLVLRSYTSITESSIWPTVTGLGAGKELRRVAAEEGRPRSNF